MASLTLCAAEDVHQFGDFLALVRFVAGRDRVLHAGRDVIA